MTTTVQHIYDDAGAQQAAGAAYRSALNSDDSEDLSSPVGPETIRASEGKTRLAISARFSAGTDQADLHVIGYSRVPDGSGLYALGVQTFPGIVPGTMREGATMPYHAAVLPVDLIGCQHWEVRVTGVVGTIDNLFCWPY